MSNDQIWSVMVFNQWQPSRTQINRKLCPMSLPTLWLVPSVSCSNLNHWFSLKWTPCLVWTVVSSPKSVEIIPQRTMLGGDLGEENASWEAFLHEQDHKRDPRGLTHPLHHWWHIRRDYLQARQVFTRHQLWFHLDPRLISLQNCKGQSLAWYSICDIFDSSPNRQRCTSLYSLQHGYHACLQNPSDLLRTLGWTSDEVPLPHPHRHWHSDFLALWPLTLYWGNSPPTSFRRFSWGPRWEDLLTLFVRDSPFVCSSRMKINQSVLGIGISFHEGWLGYPQARSTLYHRKRIPAPQPSWASENSCPISYMA